MQAIVHDSYGTPEVLEIREIDRPAVGPDAVSISVHSASVNPLDWHFLTGTPYFIRLMAGLRRPKRVVPGVDVAGTVIEVGADVSEFAPGDRVFGTAPGAFAEVVVAPKAAKRLVRIPDGVEFADAAAIPIAGITALQALRDQAKVEPGQRVLVNGAAGGVGTFAVQLAVAMGAEVTGVCSTRNVEMVRGLGAHRVVDYTSDDFVDGTRYDVIIDNVGNRTLSECQRSLTDHGVYVMISGKKSKWISPMDRAVAGKVRFMFSGQRFAQFTAGESADELEHLLGYLERGEMRPVIDRHYPFTEAAEAVRYLATGHARAKVIIDVQD